MSVVNGINARLIRPTGHDISAIPDYGPPTLDVVAINDSGGDLVGATSGSDWVEIDLAKLASDNQLPVPIQKGSNNKQLPVLGVVHWSCGTVADGASCVVRIYGIHPYAKVNAAASNIAIGDALVYAAAGIAKKAAGTEGAYEVWGWALEAETQDNAPCKVLLLNPSGIAQI